jgi:hypothetical protein
MYLDHRRFLSLGPLGQLHRQALVLIPGHSQHPALCVHVQGIAGRLAAAVGKDGVRGRHCRMPAKVHLDCRREPPGYVLKAQYIKRRPSKGRHSPYAHLHKKDWNDAGGLL